MPSSICKTNKLYYLYTITLTQTQIKIGDITEELLQALWDNVKTVYTPNCQEVLPEDEFDYFIIKIEAICDNYIEEKL